MTTKTFKFLALVAIVSVFALSGSVALANWTAPVNTPPTCDPATDGPGCLVPINVGVNKQSYQQKQGILDLGLLSLTGGYIPGDTATSATKDIYASITSGWGFLNIFGRGTAGNRTVKVWDNLNVDKNIYAQNYYICSSSGSCSPFTGGSNLWTEGAKGSEIFYKGDRIGVGRAITDPQSSVDIAIGSNSTGIKGGASLGFVVDGSTRLSVDSPGNVTVSAGDLNMPAYKYLKLGTANLKASASSLDITGVGTSPKRRVTVFDELWTTNLCTTGGTCKSISEIFNNLGGGINFWKADTIPGYITTSNIARAKGVNVSTVSFHENNSVIADNVRAANTVYTHEICLLGGTDFTGGTGGMQCKTSFSATAAYPNIVQCIFTPNPDTVSGGSCTWSGIDEADATIMSCPTNHAYKVVSGGVECGKADRVEASTATGNTSWKVNCEDKLVKSSITCIQVGN